MKFFFFLLIIVPASVFAQVNNVKGVLSDSFDKANNLYSLGFYNEAIKYFEAGLKTDPSNYKGLELVATCYMKIGDYRNSFMYYSVLFDLSAVRDVEIVKNFAEVSLSIGNLEKASDMFKHAIRIDGTNDVLKNKLEGILNYSVFFKDSALVSIKAIGLNTKDSEFGLRPFFNEVSLVSSKNHDLIIERNYLRDVESFTNLYLFKGVSKKNSGTGRIIKLKNYLSSNDGPLSKAQRFIAISRNNGKTKRNVKNTLGIYFYAYQDGEMVFESEFTFNNSLYSNTHPWLNTIGDTLYYVSNMHGTYGGFDIYYSVFSNYKWSVPVNLGENINTSANELFPMIDNGELYFTSNGHKGLGGLDNYKVNLGKGNQEVINLGYPINSGFDDMSIYIELDSGFVASNRPGGKGMDDIYQFKITPAPEAKIKILVLDKLNQMPVQDVSVTYKTYTDSLSLMTSAEGIISAFVSPSYFIFHIIKEGYEHESFPTMINNGDEYEKTVYLEPIIDLEIIAPDSIMFHLGKFELKEIAEEELLQIVHSMDKYPHLKLMIAAHTDARGSTEYNQTLSEKRAEATFNYLVKLGIDPIRISQSGYGETRLINKCSDGVECSEEEHAANRRIEFFLSIEFEEEKSTETNILENN